MGANAAANVDLLARPTLRSDPIAPSFAASWDAASAEHGRNWARPLIENIRQPVMTRLPTAPPCPIRARRTVVAIWLKRACIVAGSREHLDRGSERDRVIQRILARDDAERGPRQVARQLGCRGRTVASRAGIHDRGMFGGGDRARVGRRLGSRVETALPLGSILEVPDRHDEPVLHFRNEQAVKLTV